jgi:hypothetical protein
MKRKVEVITSMVRISALINTKDEFMTRDEVEHLRDDLADKLQYVVSDLRYAHTPINRVIVR